MRYFLLGFLALTGCGANQGDAPSVAGAWSLSLTAIDVHPACHGTAVLTERGPDALQQVQGLEPGQTYVDGPWSCGDATGLAGGLRVGDSIDLTLTSADLIWMRATVDVTADSISGGGLVAIRQ